MKKFRVMLLFFGLVMVVMMISSTGYADSDKIQNPDNGHWYQRVDKSMTWYEAKAYCKSKGGHLATLTSKEENDFVYKRLVVGSQILNLWLGATDETQEGAWKWITEEAWNYTSWASGQPDNYAGNESYLQFWYVGNVWNDSGDNNNYSNIYAICEWDDYKDIYTSQARSPLTVVSVTDTNTDLGSIITNSGKTEIITVSGEKDKNGNLTSVTDVTWFSDTSQGINLHFDKDMVTLDFSDGTKIEVKNYNKDTKTADLTVHTQSGITQLNNQKVNLPDDFSDEIMNDIMDFVHISLRTIWGIACDAMPTLLHYLMYQICGNSEIANSTQIEDVGGTDPFCFAGYISKVLSIPLVCPIQRLRPECLQSIAELAISGLKGDTCLKKKPSNKGNSWGDTHLCTFDNLAYDFQAVGEFIFVKSTLPNNSFEVQVRQIPWGTRTDVSVNKAVAMNVSGDKVGFYSGKNPPCYINGFPKKLNEGDNFISPKGGIINKNGQTYTVIWQDESAVAEIKEFSYGFLINVYVADSYKNQVIGLMGNLDGNSKNDIATRSGVSLGTDLKFDVLYPGYADSWRISQNESLFYYAAGETTVTFTDLNFPRKPAKVSQLWLTEIYYSERGDNMSDVMISLPDDRFLQLREMAVRFRVTPEELAMVSIFNLLRQPEDVFKEATDYVLRKNAELYKRLA